MRKHLRQATELMVLIDHHFIENSTSPSFTFSPCLFHMGISFSLGTRLIGVFLHTHGCEKPKSKSRAKANFVYL